MRYYVIAECEDGDVMITPSDTKKDYFENWAMAKEKYDTQFITECIQYAWEKSPIMNEGDFIDTYEFMNTFKMLLSYITHYEHLYKKEVELDVMDMYEALEADSSLSIRDYFEKLIKED